MIVVYPSVRALRKVSGNNLISRHKALYLRLLTERSYNWAISVSANQGTSYRHKHYSSLHPYKKKKNRQQWTLTRTRLQLARFMRRYFPSQEGGIGDSVFYKH